jgi:hypothetical protein
MQLIMNVRHAVLFVVLGLLGTPVPAVAQTCQWSSVGGGMNFVVAALTGFNDGTGSALHAGGPLRGPAACPPTASPNGTARSGRPSAAA